MSHTIVVISNFIGFIGFLVAFIISINLYRKTKEIFSLWGGLAFALAFLTISPLILFLEKYGFDLSVFGNDPELYTLLVGLGALVTFLFFSNQDFIKPIYKEIDEPIKMILFLFCSLIVVVLVVLGVLLPYSSSIPVRGGDINLLQSFVDNQAGEISGLLKMFEYDIFLVTDSPHLKEFADNKDSSNLPLIEGDYLSLANTKPWYYQIRFIDKNGNETVRVDRYNLSNPAYVVLKEKLQYKGDRYYFPETFNLNNGEMFISPIDLNKEGSPPKLEVPFKPVIRYGLPLFNSLGEKEGIVITNSDFGKILNLLEFSEPNVNGDLLMLVDTDGQYLFNENKSKEWGAEVNLNTSENIKKDYPLLAEKIFSSDEGVVVSGVEGVGVYRRIYISELDKSKYVVLVAFIPRGNYISA